MMEDKHLQFPVDKASKEGMSSRKKALKDPRVKALREEVESHYKIQWKRNHESSWSSKIESGIVQIGYCDPDNHPGGALAHELLHALVQQRGFRHITSCYTDVYDVRNADEEKLYSRLMACLDNELQHHKMYEEFLSHQFQPEEFYNDSDKDVASHLDKFLNAERNYRIEEVIPELFTAIAPGGNHTDQEETIRTIWRAIKSPSRTWFGYFEGSDFPNNGFFVDGSFTLDELRKVVK